MEKVCLDRLSDVNQLLEFNMVSDAADKLKAFYSCAERSDCQFWMNCSQRVEDLWQRHNAAVDPSLREPS